MSNQGLYDIACSFDKEANIFGKAIQGVKKFKNIAYPKSTSGPFANKTVAKNINAQSSRTYPEGTQLNLFGVAPETGKVPAGVGRISPELKELGKFTAGTGVGVAGLGAAHTIINKQPMVSLDKPDPDTLSPGTNIFDGANQHIDGLLTRLIPSLSKNPEALNKARSAVYILGPSLGLALLLSLFRG